VWQARRHAQRLVRDALSMELGLVDLDECLRAFDELAAVTRDGSTTIVRVAVQRDGDALRLVGSRREWSEDPPTWRAAIAPMPHPGASSTSQVKSTERALYLEALAAVQPSGAHEALLLDRAGFLVEGARTNILVVRADGVLLTPPLARGGVAGIAREVLVDSVPALREADIAGGELPLARELIAINAVRGARPITHLDGAAIGDARPGPWSARLAAALRDA
jgi:branched-subunit amino acid aminotransferase/4-amino-4-deoxychorismate lyase